MDIEKLAQQQERNAESFNKIISNYKKDPADRKTQESYFRERLRRLKEAWEAFEEIDNQIRSIPDVPTNHDYFIHEVYDTVLENYRKFKGHFEEKIAVLLKVKPTLEGEITRNQDQQGPQQSDAENKNIVTMTTQPTDEINRIIRRHNAIVVSLRRVLSGVDFNLNPELQHTRSHWEYKLRAIEQYWVQLEELHTSIYELSDDNVANGYDEEEHFILAEEVEGVVTALIARLQECAPRTGTTAAHTLPLPKMELPKFDGDYSKWQQFHDLFKQMVHMQPMANCQKMWYLKTNLTGEAERLIRHYSTSDSNYVAAWKTLEDRYANPRLLVSALISKLLTQPSTAAEKSSPNAIRNLHDVTKECLMGLENLGVSTKEWDPILTHVLTKKLDRDTHTIYEQSLDNPKELQTTKQVMDFLEKRFQSLEALGKDRHIEDRRRLHPLRTLVAAASSSECLVCKGNHALYACKEFLDKTPAQRLNVLKKYNLCINCLKEGHRATTCPRRSCTKCSKKHNTLVHLEAVNSSQKINTTSTQFKGINPTKTTGPSSVENKTQGHDQALSLSTVSQQRLGYVLLGTARVKLESHNGEFVECRALLDSGSQVNFITERLVKKLKIPAKHDSLCIQGIGHTTQRAHKRVNVHLQSRLTGFSARIEALVLPKLLSPQPTQSIDISQWNIPKNIKLADPNFNCTEHIDLLIGAELYHELLSVGQIRSNIEMPTFQNTVFGWMATGRIGPLPNTSITCGMCIEDENLNKLIEKFWTTEEPEEPQTALTTAEKWCEKNFIQTTHRDIQGRFTVKLPFSDDPTSLGESKPIALRRLYALERRLANNKELKQQYDQFMNEYITLNHMTEVELPPRNSPHYFLPHHCVQKPDSSTTKLRVVFDASCKTSSNISLNDILHVGPRIQDDLFTILLRFRLPRFVFTADVEKMYRQVLLHKEDRKYQLILWRKDVSDPVKCYQLNTVTYGTSSAPYLSIKCLQQLSQTTTKSHPFGSKILQHDFYVDDVMTGANSLSTALEMQRQLIDVLQGAGFKLRKWCANHPRLIQNFGSEDKEVQLDFKNDSEDNIKTLGLTWLPKVDDFCIKTYENYDAKVTKRKVSSEIARIFDPLGIMAPVVITAKIFLQQLWKLKLDWDAALPQELHSQWSRFRDDLKAISLIRIPRHIFSHQTPEVTQVHVFADASERAYGASIYIRSTVGHGTIIVRLLCAKSRVAPLEKEKFKKPTIPRLELCAAKLATDLANRIKRDIGYEDAPTYFWSDSEIVLAWINSSEKSLPTFIANRVSSIKVSTTPQQWRHVKSKENPADLLTRGITPERLKECNLWFYGPLFLHGRESSWPQPYNKSALSEQQPNSNALPITTNDKESGHFIYEIKHGNSFQRVQRITAYILRFVSKLKGREDKTSSKKELSSQALTDSLHTILRFLQKEEFNSDIAHLKQYSECEKTSAISSLAPFLDTNDIMRVGGRLEASALSYDAKHPILLPYGHSFTKMIMTEIHCKNKHVGPQTLLAITRQRFWPIKGKTIARSIVQNCIRCAKAKPKLLSQMMGSLPADRVQPARPFINSGVDFCGPIWIHYRGRGSRPQKGYIAIFCCFATKAVHLEIVSALTTEAFIGALKRFMGRRGHVRNLYCDNATNFVGARNQLQDLSQTVYSTQGQESISNSCSTKGIDFHFIPPRSPHFGGLWEAAVKSAKHLLYRSVSSAPLTHEEFETLIIEIEAILNSRPLTPLSSDPNDLTALTPGHFLIGEPLTAPIDANAKNTNVNLPTRWKLVTHLKNEFWRRWSSEYLNELQQRVKWKQQKPNLQPGAIVLIKEDNTPSMKWPLGRVIKTHIGEDGQVRVADVKTSTSILRRAIHKLAPLPLNDETPKQERPHHFECHTKRKAAESTSQITGESTNNDQPPKRKCRKSYGSAMLSILIVCLIVPLTCSYPVEVSQFPSKLGLHFEALGTANLAANEWNLVVYYELTPYWTEFHEITKGIKSLRQLCQVIPQNNSCKSIIDQFSHVKEELTTGNEFFSRNLHKARPRARRGAFNIVGTIANSLFGVLDSEYAQEVSKTIDDMKGNEDHVLRLLNNQTSIIDSTLNIIRGNQLSVQEKFRALNEQINQITAHTTQEELTSTFLSLSIELTLIMSNTQRIQALLIRVLIDTNHGKISPLLLSPQQLSHEVIMIKAHVPSSLRLPIDSSDLLHLYQLMSVKSGIVNDHVIFQIKFPLVNIEVFAIFRVLAIPIFKNGSLIAINPDSSHLIISPHRDQYYPITEQELAMCSTTEPSTYICEQTKPLYRKKANICTCEVDLLNNMPLPTQCKITELTEDQVWIRLSHPNEWIYALRTKTTINTVCGNEISPITLEGSGLLKIQPNCVIKQDLLTFQGHKIYTSIGKPSYTKLVNLTDIAIPSNLIPTNEYSLADQLQLAEIERLRQEIKQLPTEIPHKISNHDLHQYSVAYLGLILTVSAIIFWIWKTRKTNKPSKPSPSGPIPRIRRKFSLPSDEIC